MKIPTFQLLHGRVDQSSAQPELFEEVGHGRPQEDLDNIVNGKAATLITGGYALACDDESVTWKDKSWSIQIYGDLGNRYIPHSKYRRTVIASKGFPAKVGDRAIAIHTNAVDLLYASHPNSIVSSLIMFPPGLEYGAHYYRFAHDGTSLTLWVDETHIGTWILPISPEDVAFTLLGTQTVDGVVRCGMESTIELFRYDAGHVITPEEFYYFRSQKNRSEALSFFSENDVPSVSFDGSKLENVINYSPPLSDKDVEEAEGEERLIPPMLAPIQDGFKVEVNSSFGTDFKITEAFQDVIHADTRCWASSNALPSIATPHIVTVTFPEVTAFNSFSISQRQTLVGFPSHFFLEGMGVESGEWELIKEYSLGLYQERTFYGVDVGNVNKYKVVRLRIVENQNELLTTPAVFYTALANCQFFNSNGSPGAKIFRYTDQSASKTQLEGGGAPEEGAYVKTATKVKGDADSTLTLTMSDDTEFSVSGITDVDDVYYFPPGNGYLVNDSVDVDKFVPMSFVGLEVIQQQNKKVVSYANKESVIPSVEYMVSGANSKTTGEVMNPNRDVKQWHTLPLIGELNGTPFDFESDELAPGEYYGSVVVCQGKVGSCAYRLFGVSENALVCDLPSSYGHTSWAGGGRLISKVFFQKKVGGVLRLETFNTGQGTASSVGVLLDGASIVVSELRLIKVA